MRSVDLAMSEDRPEKRVIRELWVEKIIERIRESSGDEVPLYLTLPGAEGRDIELLIERGILTVTEVRSITEADQWKVIAVESSNLAIAELQGRFTGLRIRETNVKALVRGDDLFSWPSGVDEKYCRARVVNLDLNTSLRGTNNAGHIRFPVIQWIKKLAQLHGRRPYTNWTLCLTLHGEVTWDETVDQWVRRFLRDNISRDSEFRERCKAFLGSLFVDQVCGEGELRFGRLDRSTQQRIVMVLVPKLIALEVHSLNWCIHNVRSIQYGADGHAPMASWMVDFSWETSGSLTPDALYSAALGQLLLRTEQVDADGKISMFVCRPSHRN